MAIKPSVARHYVRDEIQRRILTGESRAGERLSQQALARDLGVAQGTVRESLLELQWLGLVDFVDRLGVFVGKLDASRLCEAYEVREFMEGLAARLACSQAARADISALREMAANIFNLAKREKSGEMGSLDRNFHLRITELSRNEILLKLAETYRVLGMAVHASCDPRAVYEEHLDIVKAIEHDFPDQAEQLARHHVAGARRMIERQAQEGKFIPRWVR